MFVKIGHLHLGKRRKSSTRDVPNAFFGIMWYCLMATRNPGLSPGLYGKYAHLFTTGFFHHPKGGWELGFLNHQQFVPRRDFSHVRMLKHKHKQEWSTNGQIGCGSPTYPPALTYFPSEIRVLIADLIKGNQWLIRLLMRFQGSCYRWGGLTSHEIGCLGLAVVWIFGCPGTRKKRSPSTSFTSMDVSNYTMGTKKNLHF